MSDKTSDKRYRITLTGRQLALVGDAVELMMRTGMGRMGDLAEWMTLSDHDMPSGAEFNIYLAQRCLIQSVLTGIARDVAVFSHGKGESNALQELKTLHEAIGHQRWKDSGEDEWDTRSHEPMMCGKEPVPRIERIDE